MGLSKYDKIGEIAKRNNLDIYINDEEPIVRKAVALQGYGLNQLINDPDYRVKQTVIRYCERHSDDLECQNILRLYKL